MLELSKSRNITDALKGMAILIVICAHFFSNFAGDFYARWLTEYAISFIAIFFVLSGFGNYQSLERRLAGSGNHGRIMLKFAFDRAIRIYPLYWLSIITMPIFMDEFSERDFLYTPTIRTVLIWLGVPLVRFSVLWFITAIIQCYWAAPILFLLIKKLSVKKYALLLTAVMAATLFVSTVFYLRKFELIHVPAMGMPMAYFFKGYFLGNIMLFAMGMLIAPIAVAVASRLKNPLIMAASAVAYLSLIYLLRFPDMVFEYSELFLVPALFFSCFAFCLCAVINQPKLPLESFFILLGKHALTLYLFHYQFLFALGYIGLIGGQNYLQSGLVALAFSPALLLICIGLDKAIFRPRSWLEKKVNPFFAG